MKNIIGSIVNTNSVLDCKKIIEIVPVQAKIKDGEFKYVISSIEEKTHNMIVLLDNNDKKFNILIDKDVDVSMLIDLV